MFSLLFKEGLTTGSAELGRIGLWVQGSSPYTPHTESASRRAHLPHYLLLFPRAGTHHP